MSQPVNSNAKWANMIVFSFIFQIAILIFYTIEFSNYQKKSVLNYNLIKLTNAKVQFKITNAKYVFVKPTIYIVILIQMRHSPRTPFLLKAWGDEFSKIKGATFSIYTSIRESWSFIDPEIKTKYNFRFVKVPNEKIAVYQSFVYLDYQSAREFYYNTTHEWYLRTSYDALIHIKNLYKYLEYLNKKYNPRKDVVFKGHHCQTFVHGGSGWLMSRACVKKYLELENYCMDEYKKKISADDVNINHFIFKMNFTKKQIHTPTFVGWPVKNYHWQLLVNSSFNFSVIQQPCSKKLQIARVNEIVSWHNRQKIDYVNTIGKKVINEAPDDIGLHYYPHVGGEFCRLKKTFTAYK